MGEGLGGGTGSEGVGEGAMWEEAPKVGSGAAAPVSDDLMRVMVKAREVSLASGGAFDVTVGPLVVLWREARRSGTMPDGAALSFAQERVGYQKVEIDERARTIRLIETG